MKTKQSVFTSTKVLVFVSLLLGLVAGTIVVLNDLPIIATSAVALGAYFAGIAVGTANEQNRR